MFNDEFEVSAKFLGMYDNVFEVSEVDGNGLLLKITQSYPFQEEETFRTQMNLEDVARLIKLLTLVEGYIKENV